MHDSLTIVAGCCSIQNTSTTLIIGNNTMLPLVNVTIPKSPMHPNLTFPTATGINDTEATRLCQQPIMQSPVFSLCKTFTDKSLLSLTKNCKLDLLVSAEHSHVFFCQ